MSWIYHRLFLLPFYIIHATYVLSAEKAPIQVFYYWEFNIFLSTLVVFHVYWFILIIKVLIRTLTSSMKDVREPESHSKDWVLAFLGKSEIEQVDASAPTQQQKAKKKN